MTDSASTAERPALTNLSLVNLSLGIAFALSSMFSIGAKLLGVLGITSVLRILQPYQQHFLLALINYWLPAVFIYIFLRLTRLDYRLRPSAVVHSAILLANILLILYVASRIYASTVPGGGISFVVVSMSPLAIYPAWILLTLGFVVLGYKSLRLVNTQPPLSHPPRFTASDSIFTLLALVIPAAFAMTLPISKMVSLSTEFTRLCNRAEVKVLERVQGAKSIALLPDLFSSMAEGQQTETRPWGGFLLNQSSLEFVERPSTKETGIEGQAKYERISTVGARILRSMPNTISARTQYVYEPVNELTAEYEVRPIPQNLNQGGELGLGGARIEIRRKLDNHLVAYAQYYWNNKEFRACPQDAHGGMFIYQFVAGALNIKVSDGPFVGGATDIKYQGGAN